MTNAIKPGWYPDPESRGQRWWDGRRGVHTLPSLRLTYRRFNRLPHFPRKRSRVGSPCSSLSSGRAQGTSTSA